MHASMTLNHRRFCPDPLTAALSDLSPALGSVALSHPNRRRAMERLAAALEHAHNSHEAAVEAAEELEREEREAFDSRLADRFE